MSFNPPIKIRGYSTLDMAITGDSRWVVGTGVSAQELSKEVAQEIGKTHEYWLYTDRGWVEVEQESIGVFTGLIVEDNKELFGGDIVEAWSQGAKGTFEVRWRQGGRPCWILYPAWHNGETWSLHGTRYPDGVYYDKGVYIIGNTYENPNWRG